VIAGGGALAAASAVPAGWAIAQAKPLKVGLMLPYSGTFAKLGENITFAIEVLINERGGKLGGRELQIIKLDDESKPEIAPQNADRLVKRDQVDVLIGTVHSGVQMGIHKVVTESGTLTIVPNAGNVAVTRELCAKNVFRSSFTNWQPAYGMGVAAGQAGYRKAVWVTWDYAAGAESGAGFKEAFEKSGGEMLPNLTLPFPQTNFQPLLAQIPGLGIDVVGAFFAGGGAVQFVREYAAAGLKAPLCGSGFLTEGTLEAQGAAAEGVQTALHYGDGLDNPKNIGFRRAFKDKAGRDADVYAVQGYDAAQLLAVALEAVNGNIEDEANLYKALRSAKIDSPRGPIAMSPAQNVTQNIYLRRAEGGLNKVVGIAAENLADPGTGCKLA
jgi:branched-chain amino acid transport system substrate-binding protein